VVSVRRVKTWSLLLVLLAFAELWYWATIRCVLVTLSDVALYTLVLALITYALARMDELEGKAEEKEG
jgi:hypothetical protein